MAKEEKVILKDDIKEAEQVEEIISVRDRIREKLGIDDEPIVDYAYLYRFEPGSLTVKSLVKGFRNQIPPDLGEIQERFGGGSYLLQTRFKDPDTPSGYNMDKWFFKIEGRPKFAENEKQYELPAAKERDVLGDIEKTANVIKAINPVSGNSGIDATVITLIMETIKSMNAQTLELIKSQGKQSGGDSNNDFMKEILTTLLKISLEKTDVAKEVESILNITNSLREGTSEPTIAKQITDGIKEAAPVLDPIVTKLINGAAARRNNTPALAPGPASPAAAQNPVVNNEFIAALDKNFTEISKNFTYINKWIHDKEFWELADEVLEDLQENKFDKLEKTEDIERILPTMAIKFELFAKAIRQVDEQTKLEFLDYYLNDEGMSLALIKFFCVTYKAVDSGAEFDALYNKLQSQQGQGK